MTASRTNLSVSILCALALGVVSLTLAGAAGPAGASLPPLPAPTLERVLRTSPFPGSTISASDHEGSAYVPRDGSVWLADDDGRSVYEVDAVTGALKGRVRGSQFANALRLNAGDRAGTERADDIQALAYDAVRDALYVFSGTCCADGLLPTAFRLTRSSGALVLDSFQPVGIDVNAAAWNPADRKLYVGRVDELRSYAYESNTLGSALGVPGLNRIYGMDFTDDGADLFVARPPTTISRVDWASKTLVPGWDLDLASFGLRDVRAVEVINEQLWVSDGDDFRAAADPLNHGLFVIGLGAAGSAPQPPPPTGPAGPGGSGGSGGSGLGPNLVGNPGFERNLKGWATTERSVVTLKRTRQHHSGAMAARVQRTRGTGKLTLTDGPSWVTTSRPGNYTGSLWVRSGTPGSKLKLTLREVRKGRTIRASVVRVRLTTSWQQVSASLVPRKPQRSEIDFSAAVKGDRGASFDADDAGLYRF